GGRLHRARPGGRVQGRRRPGPAGSGPAPDGAGAARADRVGARGPDPVDAPGGGRQPRRPGQGAGAAVSAEIRDAALDALDARISAREAERAEAAAIHPGDTVEVSLKTGGRRRAVVVRLTRSRAIVRLYESGAQIERRLGE